MISSCWMTEPADFLVMIAHGFVHCAKDELA